ncbi:MAG: glycosyltransferase family 4 protein [Arachnia propionica]|uniref:glycosyltransferase family 4 protein n=1 Tax=Arachnia propionica TaxID=1750 RepID=UPI0026F748E4|nr:glycosyltransferase family 4 protein [Arachnia propionica]
MKRIGYVLKVYPRFSETFIVTEILARESHDEEITIFALRPTTDARFHPEIARVQAPVRWVPRPLKSSDFWLEIARTLGEFPTFQEPFARIAPQLADLPTSEVAQGIALARMALDEGIDHLHAHFASMAGRVAWIASRLSGLPYTVTTHAKDIYHESVDPVWLRRVCGDAQQVIAISQFNQRHLEQVLEGTGANVVLQYNALELDRFIYSDPAPRGEVLRISAVGRLVPKKGFADLIAAVARLEVSVEVQIAGDGEERAALEARITEAGLGDRVRLIGPRTQSEVIELVRNSDVFAAPCIPAEDGNIDGLPTVVLEAMALGTPVLATSVSGLPEVIQHLETGLMIEPGDVAALTEALTRIATGQVPVERLARNARALIEERFDSRRQAARLLELQNDEVK